MRISTFLACLVTLAMYAAQLSSEGFNTSTSLELQGFYGFPNLGAADGSSGFAPIDYRVIDAPGTADRSVGSTWGAAGLKAILNYRLVVPALVMPGPLTQDNNLAFDISGEIAPVSLNANFGASLTPIAFLSVAVGGSLGTGWDIGFTGLGVNNSGTIEARNFGGVVYRLWAKGSLQFDLAAVLPGKWNHLVMLAAPKVEYQAYSGAAAGQAWVWEADEGMNFNGLKLKGSYFLGYQMPIALNMAGFLLETDGYLGAIAGQSTKSSGGWGSDYSYLSFGPVLNFSLDGRSSIAILPQFKTGIKWTDATTMKKYFADRVFDSSYVYFYRIAFDYSLKL